MQSRKPPRDAPVFFGERRLTLEELIPPLRKARLLSDAALREIQQNPAVGRLSNVHPLTWLAERKLKSPDGKPLTIERLVHWLADHAGLPFFSIDPLKINVDEVAKEVSQTYTTRYRILPVAVTETTVTFATAEPYEREWNTKSNTFCAGK